MGRIQKISKEEAKEIKRLKKAGNTLEELAYLYDLSVEGVRKIVNRVG